jgi:carbonic anhydrase
MLLQSHLKFLGKSSRRSFVAAVAGASMGSMASFCRLSIAKSQQEDELVQPLTKKARDTLTPDDIIARARAGNRRFYTGQRQHRDFLEELHKTANGQWPAAVVLGCIDSRAPAEIIFDMGLGDVFNCRVAGNVESPDILGSIEFATKLSGAKVVFILGHSACGAIKGAISDAKLGNLTQLLMKIRPAIEQTEFSGNRSADNSAFVDAVARKSVELTMGRLRTSSSLIADMEEAGTLDLVGCYYDLSTGRCEFKL